MPWHRTGSKTNDTRHLLSRKTKWRGNKQTKKDPPAHCRSTNQYQEPREISSNLNKYRSNRKHSRVPAADCGTRVITYQVITFISYFTCRHPPQTKTVPILRSWINTGYAREILHCDAARKLPKAMPRRRSYRIRKTRQNTFSKKEQRNRKQSNKKRKWKGSCLETSYTYCSLRGTITNRTYGTHKAYIFPYFY